MSRLLHATIIAAALLIAPVNAGEPIRVYLDGQPIGTLAELEYRLSEGEIHISTNELVYGCRQDRTFWDRFEDANNANQ
jgi:hypothetical protein